MPEAERLAGTSERKGRWQRSLSLAVHAPVFLFAFLGLLTVKGGDPKGTAIFVLTLAPFLLAFALALAAQDRPEPRVDRLLLASSAVSVVLGGVDLLWLLVGIAANFAPDSQDPGNLVYLFPFLGGIYAVALAILARPMGLLGTRVVRQTGLTYLAFVTGTVALAAILPSPVP